MIIRNKRPSSTQANEITFSMAYTIADVRQWLERLYINIDKCGVPQLPFSEEEIKSFIIKDPLREYAAKYSEWVAEWAWSVAVREGFVEPSSITDGMYYISPKYVLPRKETYKEHRSNMRARAKEAKNRKEDDLTHDD